MSKHAEFAEAFRKSTLQKWALDTEKVDRLESRIKELEAMVQLADLLINGNEDRFGMSCCLDGYYADLFIDYLDEWDKRMEGNDE